MSQKVIKGSASFNNDKLDSLCYVYKQQMVCGIQNEIPDILNLMDQTKEKLETNKCAALKKATQSKIDSFFK